MLGVLPFFWRGFVLGGSKAPSTQLFMVWECNERIGLSSRKYVRICMRVYIYICNMCIWCRALGVGPQGVAEFGRSIPQTFSANAPCGMARGTNNFV